MVGLSNEVMLVIDRTGRPGRILARRQGVDVRVDLGERPLSDLAAKVSEVLGGDTLGVLGFVTGPGPLLPLRSAAAFVRFFAWSQGRLVVSFRSLDPLATRLGALLGPGQRGWLLEPLGRSQVLAAEVRDDRTPRIEGVRVVGFSELAIGRDDLVAGRLREQARKFGAQIVDIDSPSDAELLDYADWLWRRGVVTALADLRAWYVKDSGVRRGFDVRAPDGSISRVGQARP